MLDSRCLHKFQKLKIVPLVVRLVEMFTFEVFSNGSGSLDVNNLNKLEILGGARPITSFWVSQIYQHSAEIEKLDDLLGRDKVKIIQT